MPRWRTCRPWGSFYDWFGPALERVLERLAQRVLAYVRQQEPDLPGSLLGCVKDWRIVDSTTVRLDDRLQQDYPGTGDDAALKVHKTLSAGCGTVVDYHLSPARAHDSPHLAIDEAWRGTGLLVDLGYARFPVALSSSAPPSAPGGVRAGRQPARP